MKRTVIACLLAASLTGSSEPARAQYTHAWTSASGLYPDVDCFWNLITTNPALASFSGGSLKIETGAITDGHYYFQSGSDLAIPDPWVIEVRMRLDTDNNIGIAATSAAIGFATAADVENILFIGAGKIYLWGSYFVIGPQAFVDTQILPHTYRIEVTGAGAVSVYYDGVLTLSGVVYYDPPFEDSSYLWWGDGTSHASGRSYWESVTHNGNAYESCPTAVEPTTWGRIKAQFQP